jgi:hypothetical protein
MSPPAIGGGLFSPELRSSDDKKEEKPDAKSIEAFSTQNEGNLT